MSRKHKAKHKKHQPKQDYSQPVAANQRDDSSTNTQTAEDELSQEKWWKVWRWSRPDKIQLLIAVAVTIYAALTYGLWRTTDRSVALTREQIHSGERAYLVVANVGLDEFPVAGKPIRLTYHIENTGRTPAVNVEAHSALEVFKGPPPAASDVRWDGFRNDISSGKFAIPNVVHPPIDQRTIDAIGSEQFMFNGPNSVTIEQVQSAQRLYFFGRITYSDVFRGSGETEFCFVYLPKSMHSADGKQAFGQCAFPDRNRMKWTEPEEKQ